MTPRVKRLLTRAQKRKGTFWLRRRYAGESLARTEGQPVVVRQALMLDRILRRMPVTIVPGELIVGYHPESGQPQDAPPWVSLYPPDVKVHTAPEEAAMRAGLFTSGAKTGHLTANYARLLRLGLDGFLRDVERPREGSTPEQDTQRQAMAIALRATAWFLKRYARRAARAARSASDPADRERLHAIACACQRVSHHPPRTFHEALQLVWTCFLVQCIEEGESTAAFALGRFDRYCAPFWQTDLQTGASRKDLVELVGCFWVKLNEFSGLQVLNLTIGGTDGDGRDAVNDLSFACLEVMAEMKTSTPSLSVRWHPGMDPAFLDRAVELSARGVGQPAFYSDAATIQSMVHAGVEPGDAVDVVPGGCVELGVQGCCYPWVGNFLNLPKCLELALHNGRDSASGELLGPETGDMSALDSFEKLLAAYHTQVGAIMDLMAQSENSVDYHSGLYGPYPLLSALVDDCIECGVDITRGGARYNFTEVQGVGVAHVVDALLNVRQLVFERGGISLPELQETLDANFAGDEALRQRLVRMTPCYGDNTPASDTMAHEVVHGFYDRVERYTNPRGGAFRPGLLVWTLYDSWAGSTGALPDGHRRGDALVSSIGPRSDAAVEAPTAILGAVTSFDHFRSTGGLTLNLRFDGTTVDTAAGREALNQLLEVYFGRGGMQLQLNVVNSELLREAQQNPAAHAGLVVRISGFSARFVEMSRTIQDETIARAELRAG